MLCYMSVKPQRAYMLIGDNLESFFSAANLEAKCKKHHVNIASLYFREYIAAGIIKVHMIHFNFNPSNMNTKALDKVKFSKFVK